MTGVDQRRGRDRIDLVDVDSFPDCVDQELHWRDRSLVGPRMTLEKDVRENLGGLFDEQLAELDLDDRGDSVQRRRIALAHQGGDGVVQGRLYEALSILAEKDHGVRDDIGLGPDIANDGYADAVEERVDQAVRRLAVVPSDSVQLCISACP